MRVTFRTDNGHYLRAYQSGIVAADAPAVGELDEWWTLVHLGGDVYTLQSVHGRYLCAELDGTVVADRVDAGPWEAWRLVQVGTGVAFVSHHGLYLCAEGGGGGAVVANREAAGAWEVWTPNPPIGSGDVAPVGGGPVRPLVGHVQRIGNSFGDASGPRVLHGCSDFGALAKHHQDRDRSLRQLDVVAQYHQYIRVCWRLNGSPWERNNTVVDPIRDPWFDEVCRDYFMACHERGIRLNLTSGDMYNWTNKQAEDSFRRVAQIAASVSTDLVWLSAVTNEMRGTMPGGESDENIAKMAHLLRVWQSVYPWSMLAGSDPHTQDKAGMTRLAPPPATVALIHDVRWSVPDALRRAFNSQYENFPDLPIAQDEPTGENGNVPHPLGQLVYQPVNDEDDILAIYTTHVITGQASTYFSDPSLISREPLETTWGFTNLATFWRQMEIPEDIGQGRLYHGGRAESAMDVIDSKADRADGCVAPDGRFFGVISGEHGGWRVKSRWDAQFTAWTAKGVQRDERVRAGQVLPVPGATPTVVRFVR